MTTGTLEMEGSLELEEPRAGGDLVRSSILTMAASATSLVVGVIRSKLVATLLGPTGVGVIGNLGLYTSFTANLGAVVAGPGVTRSLANARAQGDDDRVDWLVRYGLLSQPVAGIVILLVTVALSVPLAELMLGSGNYAGLLILSTVSIPIGLASLSYNGILQGFLRIGAIVRVNIAASLLSLPILIPLVMWFGLTGAVLAAALTSVVSLSIYLVSARWVVWPRAWRRPLPLHWPTLRPILQLGLATVVLALASVLTNLLIRASIVSALGIDWAGLYQPVAALSDTYLPLLISSTSLYLFPRLTELLGAGRRDQAAFELGHGLRVLLAVTVPCLIVAIAFGELLIELLYSNRFATAADPLAIQMTGSIFTVFTWSIGAALVPLGRYRAWLAIGLMHLAIKYVSTLLLLPSHGLTGVAMAWDLAYAWSFLAEGFVVLVIAGLVLPKRDLLLAALATVLVVATFLTREMTHQGAVLVAVCATAVWIVTCRSELTETAGSFVSIVRSSGRGKKTGS